MLNMLSNAAVWWGVGTRRKLSEHTQQHLTSVCLCVPPQPQLSLIVE